MSSKNLHRVFCYGSLMRGFGNNSILENSPLVGEAMSEGRFTMLHLGGFPGIVAKGTTTIHGEVFEVDDNTLSRLDRLEGHPSFYCRTPMKVLLNPEGDGVGEWIDVEGYLLPDVWLNDSYGHGSKTIVESGSWRVERNRPLISTADDPERESASL